MIFSKTSKYLNFDWTAMAAVIFLLASGLIAIYSLSLSQELDGLGSFGKQLIFLAIGAALFLVFSFLDYRVWKSYAEILYIAGIAMLAMVLIFGETIRGTSGWFSVGPFNIQPVELMKIFLVVFLAKFFTRRMRTGIGWKEFLVSLTYLAIPVFLVLRQPDFGSAMVMVVIWVGMLFLAGVDKKVFGALFVAGILISLLGWNFFLVDYQKERVEVLVNPQVDPLGSGYNIIQSMVAVGSGGIKGRGLGHGSQSQLNFLPEKHTDFIYAAIAEESGFVGSFLMLTVFGVLFYRLKKTADQARDNFGQLIIGGVLAMFFFHAFVNIGMNIGIVPVAGLSLPFVSYGGSFLIVSMLAFGIIQNIWKMRKRKKITPNEMYNG